MKRLNKDMFFVTAQPTMIRGIRGAEAACSVHESPFGADDCARTVEHYNAEQLLFFGSSA